MANPRALGSGCFWPLSAARFPAPRVNQRQKAPWYASEGDTETGLEQCVLAGLPQEREEDVKNSGCKGIKLKYSYRPVTSFYILISEVTKWSTSVYVWYVTSTVNPSERHPPGVYAPWNSLPWKMGRTTFLMITTLQKLWDVTSKIRS